jgi:hypothetical protein
MLLSLSIDTADIFRPTGRAGRQPAIVTDKWVRTFALFAVHRMRLGILADHTFLAGHTARHTFFAGHAFRTLVSTVNIITRSDHTPVSNDPIIIILCLPFANFNNTIITLGVAQRCQDSVHGLESVVRS